MSLKGKRTDQEPPSSAKKQRTESANKSDPQASAAVQDSKVQEPPESIKNPILHVGVTGSRDGWTDAQKKRFCSLLQSVGDEIDLVFHHGDCKGVDVQAATECRARKPRSFIEIHPPTKNVQRAFFKDGNKTHTSKPYLDRNKDIVDASDEVWAFPNTDRYQTRSGTWFTIKYAQSQRGKRLWIILPDGQIVAGDQVATT